MRKYFYFKLLTLITISSETSQSQIDYDFNAFNVRSSKKISVIAGLESIKGLYWGGGYQFSNDKSIQLSVGTAPFIELSGKKVFIISIDVRHYFVSHQIVSPTFSTIFSFGTLRSTNNVPLGNQYILSPNVGLDATWLSGLNLYIETGPALSSTSPGTTRIVLNLGLGAGYRF